MTMTPKIVAMATKEDSSRIPAQTGNQAADGSRMKTWHAASRAAKIFAADLMTVSHEGNRVFNSLSEENRDKERCQQYEIS